jgi:hypothetical protein
VTPDGISIVTGDGWVACAVVVVAVVGMVLVKSTREGKWVTVVMLGERARGRT